MTDAEKKLIDAIIIALKNAKQDEARISLLRFSPWQIVVKLA